MPKNATVSRQGKHWVVSIQVEMVIPEPVHPSTSVVGIDRGVRNFAVLSDGTFYAPLNTFKKWEKKLAAEQRKLKNKAKRSNNWKKQIQIVNQIHTKIAHCRNDFLHKISTEISKKHAIVVLEDLNIQNMSKSAKGDVENPGKDVKRKAKFNRYVLDQGMYEFQRQLEYKMLWNGGSVIKIDPKYTSITCPVCDHVSKENRTCQEVFKCVKCGHTDHADLNAAKRILAVGQTVKACGSNLIRGRKQESPVL